MRVEKRSKRRRDGIFYKKGIPRRTTLYITRDGELIVTSMFKEFLPILKELKGGSRR